jgi:hypothetical protein
MFFRIVFGVIIIGVFLMIYPFLMQVWTDNSSGLNGLMAGMTNLDGSPAMSDLETSIWGLFPLLFLVLVVGGYIWIMARERD